VCGFILVSLSPSGWARDTDKRTIDEITVTGTHIRRNTFDSTAPVQVIGSAAIKSAGAATVFDIVQDLPINVGSELNNEQNDLAGLAQFNLRGLGLASSLTLLNSRRGGKSAIADEGGNFFFDVNSLPLSAIERIDIQTDGASAIYGNEAVAGVVNIITRKGYEGLEISARYEDAANKAGSLNIATGIWGDRGGINVYGTYYKQTGNTRTDFPWLVERLGHTGDLSTTVLSSGTGAPGTYRRADIDPTTGVPFQVAGATANPDPDCVAARGVLSGTTCRFNFADQNGVVPEQDRYQVFSEFEYDATDRFNLFGEFSFSHTMQKRFRGPGNYSNGLIADSGNVFIPGDHPFNFFIVDPTNATDLIYIGPDEWDPVIHTGANISAQARILGDEFNGRRSPVRRETELNYFRGLGGLDIAVTDRWRATVSYMVARSTWDEDTPYDYAAQVVNQLIVDGDFNPFGTRVATPDLVSPKDPTRVAGLDDAVLQQLITPQRRTADQDQFVIDAVVAGDAFDLPAGPVGVAIGYQNRQEDFASAPGILTQQNLSGIRGVAFPVSGSLSVDAIFAEANIPATEDIELQLAVRSEDYGFTDTVDPKIAFRWDLSDNIALRGSFGTSFQAPSVAQQSEALSAAGVLDDLAQINPISGNLECGATAGQTGGALIRTIGGSLEPQSADNFNIGIIFEPLENLRVAADFWSFDYTDLISAGESAQAIVLNDCNSDGIPNDPRVERSTGGNITRVTTNFINAASVETNGVDVAVNYAADIGSLGNFAFGFNATYLNKFDFQNAPGAAVVDGVGSRNFLNPFSSLPELRGNLLVDWSRGNLFGSANVRYTDSYLNDVNDFEIDSFITLDLQIGASFDSFGEEQSSEVVVGVKNAFDEDPPSLGSLERPAYDPVLANIRGRIVYVELTQRF
jgi:outer membrane receptor protein involved in Fe transport